MLLFVHSLIDKVTKLKDNSTLKEPLVHGADNIIYFQY